MKILRPAIVFSVSFTMQGCGEAGSSEPEDLSIEMRNFPPSERCSDCSGFVIKFAFSCFISFMNFLVSGRAGLPGLAYIEKNEDAQSSFCFRPRGPVEPFRSHDICLFPYRRGFLAEYSISYRVIRQCSPLKACEGLGGVYS